MRGTRLTYAVAMVILCHILTSCVQGFMGQGLLKDPRLYNPKKATETSQSVAPEPELGLTGGVDPFDYTDKWYNKPDSNGDDSNPDEGGFDAEEFQRIQIAGWFSDEDVPTYTMTAADVWAAGDESRREYVHAGAPDTEGQGWTISGVTYYQYRGINPGYAADGNYNKALQSTGKGHPKLSRFFFYRFTGKGGGVQWLDNNLIAVDTYSKLVFAFSEPVEFSRMGAPTRWSPTDASPYIGQMYQFYMYDPVGYVKKEADGGYEVVLYQWFQDNLAKGNYLPTLGGLDANSNGTELKEIAKKTPDGAGTSPFNNHTVDFFQENMKLFSGKIFQQREKIGEEHGLVLYKYSITQKADEKFVLRRTAESWNGLETATSLADVEYEVGEGIDASSGKLTRDGKSYTFKVKDNSMTITGPDGEEVSYLDFNDPGPSFRQRVKNATYKNGATEYKFSGDGSTLHWTWDGGTGTYQWGGSPSDTEYTTYGGYRIRLYGNDSTIRGATVPYVGGASIMEYVAYRYTAKGDTFTDSVKGKTFSYRAKNEYGYDLYLHTLRFDSTGTKVTVADEPWGGEKTEHTLTVANGSDASKGKINDKDVTLTAPTQGVWTLEYDGKTYTMGGVPTPSFVNRVKNNPVYVSDDKKTVYRFSNLGKTLRMTYTGGWLGLGNFDYTYQYVQEESTEDNNTSWAVYKADNGIAGFSYAGFKLSNSDMKIQATKTSGAGPGTFAWDMTYDAQRAAGTGGLPTPEDLDYFYNSLKDKSFSTRNVENEVPGLQLLTWKFESDGAVKHTTKTWLSSSQQEEKTITNAEKKVALVAVSKTSGILISEDGTQYTFTLNEDASSLSVETKTSSGTTSLTYHKDYQDKGPGFINRVKGKTYVEAGKTKENGYSYTFSSDGKTCYYKNPNAGLLQTKEKTYTYEPDKEKGHWNEYTYATYSSYFIDVKDGSDSKKDSVLRMENTSAAVSYAIADMEWEATLSNQ